MPWCVLRYCKMNSRNTSKESKGITFHRFPRRGKECREKWIKYVRRNRSEDEWTPSKHSYLCSMHFKDEDKYTTPAGRSFLKKSAVPSIDPTRYQSAAALKSIYDTVRNYESIFDTPRIINLKLRINDLIISKKKLTYKVRKVQRQNLNLKKKCDNLNRLVKAFKIKFMMLGRKENDSQAKGEIFDAYKRIMKLK